MKLCLFHPSLGSFWLCWFFLRVENFYIIIHKTENLVDILVYLKTNSLKEDKNADAGVKFNTLKS